MDQERERNKDIKKDQKAESIITGRTQAQQALVQGKKISTIKSVRKTITLVCIS